MEFTKKKWLNTKEIKQMTKSSIVNQHRELLLPSLSQNLEIIQLEDSHISIGEWFLSKKDVQPRFLIFTTQESIELPFGLLFIQQPTLNWIPYDFIEKQAHHSKFHRMRIFIKSITTRQIVNFNPIGYLDLTMQSIWLYEKGFIYNLDFHPKEWKWKKLGGLQETTFFNYQTKRRHQQICSNSFNTSPYDKELQSLGYSPYQRRIIHNQVWHRQRPRKISLFL